MLAGVLKNETAINVSINIIRAFVEMRKFIVANGQIFERLTNVELYHCGASLKDLGKKCFAINKMENLEFINKII